MTHEETHSVLAFDNLKPIATDVASALKAAGDTPLAPELRQRFIAVRTALFTRGIYDPVLVRFDSATVPKASTSEIAEALAMVATAL
jgi:hypothetical protein